jgi:hypothetical protein
LLVGILKRSPSSQRDSPCRHPRLYLLSQMSLTGRATPPQSEAWQYALGQLGECNNRARFLCEPRRRASLITRTYRSKDPISPNQVFHARTILVTGGLLLYSFTYSTFFGRGEGCRHSYLPDDMDPRIPRHTSHVPPPPVSQPRWRDQQSR